MRSGTSWYTRWCNLYILAIVINIINLSVYGTVGTASVLSAIQQVPNTMAINCIAGVTSVLLLISELHLAKPTEKFCSFLLTFRGRGILYILLGFIVYQGGMIVNLMVSYYTIVIGLAYGILSFLPLLPLNDINRNWRAYRQYREELTASFCSTSYNHSVFTRPMASTLRAVPVESGFSSHPPSSKPSQNHPPPPRKAGRFRRDHAQLAMDINDALIQVQYSDFASPRTSSTYSLSPPPSSRPHYSHLPLGYRTTSPSHHHYSLPAHLPPLLPPLCISPLSHSPSYHTPSSSYPNPPPSLPFPHHQPYHPQLPLHSSTTSSS